MADLTLIRCSDYDPATVREALIHALDDLDGWKLFAPGKTVVIKANLVCPATPDAAATTHPTMLAELTRLLVEKGCRVIVGDSPGGLYTAAYLNVVYSKSGLQAVKEAGGEWNSDFSHKTVAYPEAHIAKSFEYTSYLDCADVVIDFCKLKTHGMMGMSAAVKNFFGIVPGTFKPEYHYRFPRYEDFADMLIDLCDYVHPQLCLCDAVVGMEGNGPTQGTPRHIGALLAAINPHILDLACARVIGLSPKEVPTLERAIYHGLIPDSLDKVSVCGEIESFCIPDYQNIAHRASLSFDSGSGKFFGFFAPIAAHALRSRPTLAPQKCVGCEKCKNICPAKAITMKKGKPCFDKKACISCFCCQEFCPKGALSVHRPLIARLLNRNRS